jgi:hypothetical protein
MLAPMSLRVVLVLGLGLACALLGSRAEPRVSTALAEDSPAHGAASFEPHAPTPEALNARVLSLVAAQPPKEARAPLEQAARALGRARAAEAHDDQASAVRATDLARAALALAEARIALARERALLRAAEVRRERAKQRAAQSRVLRDQARRRLASDAGKRP